MANFDLCFGSFVLFNEDYNPPQYKAVPDPVPNVDPDAMAIAGINSHYWPNEYAQIASLPQDSRAVSVANFYRTNFWNKWYDQMQSNRLAAMTLDASVNQGAGWGAKFLQGATGSTVDGHWGPGTIAMANTVDVSEAIPTFIELRKQRYAQTNSGEVMMRRAEKVPTFA